MAKILLVEDDNNLREIYEARLQAEGYTIISAKDGEEALVVAKKEKPDLIISDVMMPRVSGFEMLDILRNTDGLKEVKVIMLTALGQAEDKTRADSLGADRYLVKSQVTLEDIVKAAQELLGGPSGAAGGASATPPASPPSDDTTPPATPPTTGPGTSTPPAMPSTPTPMPTPTVPVTPAPAPATPTPAEPPTPKPPVTPTTPPIPPPATPTEPPVKPVEPPAPQPAPAEPPTPTPIPSPTPAAPPVPAPEPPQPAAPPSEPPQPAEPAAEPPQPAQTTDAQSISEEEAAIKSQIENFVNQNSQTAPKPNEPPEDRMMADAIKDLVSGTETETAKTGSSPEPKIVTPSTPTTGGTNAAPPQATTPEPAPVKDDDGVAIAHKKIIKPISDMSDTAPNLDELLAKEGITNMDETHPAAPESSAPSIVSPGNTPPPAPAPAVSGLPTTPHPPGHVISPNATSGVDPNSIAL